jgi:hypothetical protein
MLPLRPPPPPHSGYAARTAMSRRARPRWRTNAPSTRKTQHFEIFGNRAIYHDGAGWRTRCGCDPLRHGVTGYRDGQG